MSTKKVIRYFGSLALVVAVLVVSGMSTACSQIDDILREESTTVAVYPKSSLDMRYDEGCWRGDGRLDIKPGTKLVIHIVRSVSAPLFNTAGGSRVDFWLEASQEGLEIGENEITITEWSKLSFRGAGQRVFYYCYDSGVLKIRKQTKNLFFGGQETSFHGTVRFGFRRDAQTDTEWTF